MLLIWGFVEDVGVFTGCCPPFPKLPTGFGAFRILGLWPEPCIRLFPIPAPNFLSWKGQGSDVVRSSVQSVHCEGRRGESAGGVPT